MLAGSRIMLYNNLQTMNLFARLQTSAIWYHHCGKEHLQIAVTSVWNAIKGQEKEHHETDPKKISLCNPFQNLRFKSRSMRRKTSRYDFCLNWKVLLRRRCGFRITKTQISLTICSMPLRNSYENPGGMKKPRARKREASRGHNLSLEWRLSI